MKKLLLFLLIFSLLPISFSSAQELTGNVVFTGVRYDDDVLLSVGTGQQVVGDIWAFEYVDVGHYGALNTEVGYIKQIKSGFYAGILGGPGSDWTNTPDDGKNPTFYLVGAGGALLAYQWSDMGVWCYGKYKFSWQGDNLYQDGSIIGIGLWSKF